MKLVFESLGEQRAIGARLTLAMTWVLVLPIASAAILVDGPVFELVSAALVLGLIGFAVSRRQGTVSAMRVISGIVLVSQVSLLVASMAGHPLQIDMHMAYFAALAVLVIYSDHVVILAGATAVALHHLGLSFIVPELVFPGSASFTRVLLHAVILIVEAGTLVWVTASTVLMFKNTNKARVDAEEAMHHVVEANDRESQVRAASDRDRVLADQVRDTSEREQARAVEALGKGLALLSQGDLTVTISGKYEGRFAQLQEDFNTAVARLRDVVGEISTAAQGVRNGSDEIAAASSDLSKRTEQQASSLETTAAALN